MPGVPVRLPRHLENFGELLPLQSARSISIGMSLIQPHIGALLVSHLLWSHQLLVKRGELQPRQISRSEFISNKFGDGGGLVDHDNPVSALTLSAIESSISLAEQ